MIRGVCITTVSVNCLNLLQNGARRKWCQTPFSRRQAVQPGGRNGPLTTVPQTQVDHLRIDSWLWRTRFYKTRGLAATAVKSGRVNLNGKRVKNSRLVKLADALQINHPRGDYQLTVLSIPDRRGPVTEVERCYRIDQLLNDDVRQRKTRFIGQASGSPAKRPDKQDRRKLRALKGKL